MARQKPYVIRTPFPTEEEVIKELGLSEKDVKQVRKIFEDMLKKEAKRKKKRKKRK